MNEKKEEEISLLERKDKIVKKLPFADPQAIGLAGFGFSTVFLMLSFVTLIPLDSAILSNIILFGGLGQIISGLMEYRRGNSFGLLCFVSYGMFWISLGLMMILPLFYNNLPLEGTGNLAMGFYMLIWAIFTLGMNVYIVLNEPIVHLFQVIFFMLFFMFVGITVAEWTEHFGFSKAAAIFRIIVGVWGIVLGIVTLLASGIIVVGNSFPKLKLKLYYQIFKFSESSIMKNIHKNMERGDEGDEKEDEEDEEEGEAILGEGSETIDSDDDDDDDFTLDDIDVDDIE